MQYVDRSGGSSWLDRTRRGHDRVSTWSRVCPTDFEAAAAKWRQLPSDEGATYDRSLVFDGAQIEPQVTWGTNPGQVISINAPIPSPADCADPTDQKSTANALQYMGLQAGAKLSDVSIDRVFIGSCTNARIEDLRAAARVVRGYRVHAGVDAMVVPGSGMVKKIAEQEGLDRIFKEAGFDWRDAGCSMCLAMNPDRLEPGNVVLRLRIAILRADKGKVAERISSLPLWQPRRRSKVGLSTFDNGPTRPKTNTCLIISKQRDSTESSNPCVPLIPFMASWRQWIAPMSIHRSDHPKQFLKRIERTGFGQYLFFDWRFLESGEPNPQFELNLPRNQGLAYWWLDGILAMDRVASMRSGLLRTWNSCDYCSVLRGHLLQQLL